MNHKKLSAFTLVELSIVLVILGLLVGGVMAGQSLIRSAQIHGTIAQVDQFKTAAYTFREKYFYLPGDIPLALAERLNLPINNTIGVKRAGNGDGLISRGGGVQDTFAFGEANLFWGQLGQTGLIPGQYQVLRSSGGVKTNVWDYLPTAKIGGGMYFNVWNGGPDPCRTSATCGGQDGYNYISLSEVRDYFDYNSPGTWRTYDTLPTIDAYQIDTKMDDGMPQSGHVLAMHLQLQAVGTWAGGEYSGAGLHTWKAGTPTTNANPAGPTNCYDNNNTAGQPQRYTTSRDNKTCALSFRM